MAATLNTTVEQRLEELKRRIRRDGDLWLALDARGNAGLATRHLNRMARWAKELEALEAANTDR